MNKLILFFFTYFVMCYLPSNAQQIEIDSTVNNTDFYIYKTKENLPITYVAFQELLQGQMAGLQIQAINGDLPSSYRLYSRGISKIETNNQTPLIIIDGAPFYSVDEKYGNIFTFLHPSDIKSIQLLKNADEIAQYGIFAAQSVLIIETKKATRKNQLNIHFNHAVSFAKKGNEVDVLSTDQYRELIHKFFPKQISKLGNHDTDWQDEITRLAKGSHHYLNVNGKIKNTSYYLSGKLDKRDGVVKYSNSKKNAFLVKLKQSFYKNNIQFSIYYSRSKLKQNPYNQDAFKNAIWANPTFEAKYNINQNLFTITPYDLFTKYQLDRNNTHENLNLNLDINLPFISGLKFSALYHYADNNLKTNKYEGIKSKYLHSRTNTIMYNSNLKYLLLKGSYLTKINKNIRLFTSLTYERFLGKDLDSEEIIWDNKDLISEEKYTYRRDFSALTLQSKINLHNKFNLYFTHKLERGKKGKLKLGSSSLGIRYCFYNKVEGLINYLSLQGSYGVSGYKVKGHSFNVRNHKSNLGLNVKIVNNKLAFLLEFYQQKFKKYGYAAHLLPPATSNTSLLFVHPINWNNNGVEFSLIATLIDSKSLKWTSRANIAYNKNKIDLPERFERIEYRDQLRISMIDGKSLRQFRETKQIYDSNGKPLSNYQSPKKDYSEEHSAIPSYVYGLSSQLRYKRWDISFVLRGNIDNYIYNTIDYKNGNEQVLPAYNMTKSYFKSKFKRRFRTDYYLKNGSFLRMENIRLGYQLKNIRNSKINAYCYLVAQNLFTITKYNGLNVDVPDGNDNGTLPVPRIISLGVNLSL